MFLSSLPICASTPPVSSRSLPVSFAAFLSITSTTTIPAKPIASQAYLFWCARGLRRQQLQVVPSLLSSDLRLRPHLLFVAPSIQASGPPSVLCPAPSSCPLHPASSNEGIVSMLSLYVCARQTFLTYWLGYSMWDELDRIVKVKERMPHVHWQMAWGIKSSCFQLREDADIFGMLHDGQAAFCCPADERKVYSCSTPNSFMWFVM